MGPVLHGAGSTLGHDDMADTNLKTTVGAADSNAYVDVAYVDSVLAGWPEQVRSAWLDLKSATPTDPVEERERLILEATRLIDRYPNAKDGAGGWGARQSPTQRLAFPRAVDAVGVLPEEVKTAVVEYIAFRLEESVTEVVDLQAERVTTASIRGESGSWGENETGLPAGARNELDRLLAGYGIAMSNLKSASPDGDTKSHFGGEP
ncbi:MAG: hypothetical protein LN413_00025 [Candidatus Thermoplasmatota archaeon]|nr:hypothetical protein [Candidatus Thermoplasmatota archaeon]